MQIVMRGGPVDGHVIEEPDGSYSGIHVPTWEGHAVYKLNAARNEATFQGIELWVDDTDEQRAADQDILDRMLPDM